MGYRIRLSRINKSFITKYSDLSFEKLEKTINIDEDDTFRELPEQKELLTLQTDLNQDFFNKYTIPFFNKFEPIEYNGHCFKILTKEGLLQIIESYNDDIIELLDEQINHIENGETEITLFNLKQKRERWSFEIAGHKIRPYRIEKGQNKDYLDGSIVSDGSMEYQIFNVVFIYNTFDWENDELIISGW